ncbi:MAG: alkaline phosphatase family protein [Candidatus Xenobiia bacterium LiM19]
MEYLVGQAPPVSHLDGGNVFPTIATEGVKQSIDRGLPITYVDYTTYDESGHYYGSKTDKAMESIKVLDDKIGQVVDKIEQEKKPYDVVVFSDHGQTDCIPFSKIYGKPIQEMITDIANEGNPPVKAKKGDIEIAHTYSAAVRLLQLPKRDESLYLRDYRDARQQGDCEKDLHNSVRQGVSGHHIRRG